MGWKGQRSSSVLPVAKGELRPGLQTRSKGSDATHCLSLLLSLHISHDNPSSVFFPLLLVH